MNDIIKRNLFALFGLALLSILQGCKSLPIPKSVAVSEQSVAGNYIDKFNDNLRLKPDGTGTALDQREIDRFRFDVKYRIDGDKVIIDYYLSEQYWNSYQRQISITHQMGLVKADSSDQIKAEATEKRGSDILYPEDNNKLCILKPTKFCFVKQK